MGVIQKQSIELRDVQEGWYDFGVVQQNPNRHDVVPKKPIELHDAKQRWIELCEEYRASKRKYFGGDAEYRRAQF